MMIALVLGLSLLVSCAVLAVVALMLIAGHLADLNAKLTSFRDSVGNQP